MNLEILFFTVQKDSIIWILLSSIIGGVIGASSKFLFEYILPYRMNVKRDAKKAIQKYSYPLLRYAESLLRSMELLLSNKEKKWYDDKNAPYFKYSILYKFGCYFACVNQLEQEAFLEFGVKNKKIKRFTALFFNVLKSLTSFFYFNEGLINKKILSADVEKTNIPRLVVSAIGEIMTIETDKKEKRIISFVDFLH